MQLLASGPDLPEELFRLQETGELVFFCGSGISRPAGLPDFPGLVSRVYEAIGETLPVATPGEPEEPSDRLLFLLEQKLADPGIVRNKVRDLLMRTRRSSEAKQIHRALLDLGRGPDGRLRLVTTNFDRLFQREVKQRGYAHEKYIGPNLPLLRHNDWNGLVYLHGFLESKSGNPLRIVLTSGDFGAAYLVDRWASRFLADLFAKYTVCFVGYSLGDPVVRYMTDALAAAKLNGEPGRTHYAFSRSPDIQTWEAKGIRPIAYEVFDKNGTECHAHLYASLEKWASLWREGSLGRRGVVEECAHWDPQTSTEKNNFVGRMVWALSDPTGQAAKTFAESQTEYPESWFEELVKPRVPAGRWLGVQTPEPEKKEEIAQFSLFEHPRWTRDSAPGLVSFYSRTATDYWDPIVGNLADWFFQHLDNERFFIWAATQRHPPNKQFLLALQEALDHTQELERADNEKARNDYIATRPQGIPDKTMRWLWQLILQKKTGTGEFSDNLYLLQNSVEKDGWIEYSINLLSAIIEPVFVFSDTKLEGMSRARNGRRFSFSCGIDLTLNASIWECYWSSWLEKAGSQLGEVLEVVEKALLKALLFLRQLEMIGHSKDEMDEQLISVSQTKARYGDWNWTFLVVMLRDIWMKLAADVPREAKQIVARWIDSPHAAFRRLALFAAAETDLIAGSDWIRWLLREEREILWKDAYKREVCQLLKKRAGRLSKHNRRLLEKLLLSGPSEIFDFPPWRIDEERWVRLVKFRDGSGSLSRMGEETIARAVKANPALRTDKKQSEEFPSHCRCWNLNDQDNRRVINPPDKLEDLKIWLRENPSSNRFDPSDCKYRVDTWRQFCSNKPNVAIAALREVYEEGDWLPTRWEEAIDAWTDATPVREPTKEIEDALRSMTFENLASLGDSLAAWVKKSAETVDGCSDPFMSMCNLILSLEAEPDQTSGKEQEERYLVLSQHPAKKTAEALLEYWVPTANRSVSVSLRNRDYIQKLFANVCNGTSTLPPATRQAILAALMQNADRLFTFEKEWTSNLLLPWLGWNNRTEDTLLCWRFFLDGNSFNVELVQAVSEPFLETAKHLDRLGRSRQNYFMLLSWVAYQRREGFPKERLRDCIQCFPQEGIDYLLKRLAATAKAAGDKGDAFWRENGLPFFRDYLPKGRVFHSEEYSRSMALTIIHSGREFGEAYKTVSYVFHPIERWREIPEALLETGQCKQFPEESVSLLCKLIQAPQFMYADDLKRCVDEIKSMKPKLASRCVSLEKIIARCPRRSSNR